MAAPCPGSHVRLISLYHAGELHEAVPLGGLANSMAHKPGRLVCNAEHPVELVGADALLGSAHEIDGREPLVKRNLAILEDGPYRSGELTLAASALVEGPNGVLARCLASDGVRLVHATLGTFWGRQASASAPRTPCIHRQSIALRHGKSGSL